MITTIVQFELPEPISREKAKQLFMGSAAKYQNTSGLIRKYYLLTDDGRTAGGVYLWESREAAEQTYSEEWRKNMIEKHGSNPSLTYFESPVIVDNEKGEISQS